MSLKQKHLPDLKTLLEIRAKYSSDREFLNLYLGKADFIMGPCDSMDFIKKIKDENNGK
jgi:hypothetical protein